MSDSTYPTNIRELAQKRAALTPETEAAFQAFSQKVFAEGALPAKIKQLIAVAVAHVTQCPYCIRGHTKAALRNGATEKEIVEAIWSLQKCAPAAPTLIRFLRWMRSRRRSDLYGPLPVSHATSQMPALHRSLDR
jgi:AhpD family alkylhydroperoxidase